MAVQGVWGLVVWAFEVLLKAHGVMVEHYILVRTTTIMMMMEEEEEELRVSGTQPETWVDREVVPAL